MKKHTIRFRPEIEEREVESVTTFYNEDSDSYPDAEKSEVRKWLWGLLEEPVERDNIDGNEEYGFISEFGMNNLVVLARATEEMMDEGLIEAYDEWEEKGDDGRWVEYLCRVSG